MGKIYYIMLLFFVFVINFSFWYNITQEDRQIADMVLEKIENLIEKKWEKYRNIYIKSINKSILKNKNKRYTEIYKIILENLNSKKDENTKLEISKFDIKNVKYSNELYIYQNIKKYKNWYLWFEIWWNDWMSVYVIYSENWKKIKKSRHIFWYDIWWWLESYSNKTLFVYDMEYCNKDWCYSDKYTNNGSQDREIIKKFDECDIDLSKIWSDANEYWKCNKYVFEYVFDLINSEQETWIWVFDYRFGDFLNSIK